MAGIIRQHDAPRPGELFYSPPPPLLRLLAPVAYNAPDTSKAAAAKARIRSGTQRGRIYDFLASHGGHTNEQLAQRLQLPIQSVSARVNGLHNDGWLVDSGRRALTATGSEAIVWVVARGL